MKYLDAVLRYIDENEYTHREDVAIIISEIYETNPDINLERFIKKVRRIRRDFFRINRIKKDTFAESLYVILNRVRKERPDRLTKFKIAKNFISSYLEIGFDGTKFVEERNTILEEFSRIKKPHAKIMKAFNKLLDKINLSYQIDLHGPKEYSGIDISKRIKGATIGFQIKSRNDEISEYMIRSESSKAQDWEMDGFVLIFARKRTKGVETSMQAAHHHFKILNESHRMYCTVVYPELLSELFRKYSISI